MIFALAIAVGVLTAAGTVPAAASAGVMFFGELGLDGRLRPVRGVLPAVAAAAEDGRFGTVLVAEQNAPEAALVPGVRVIAASTLTAVIDWLRGTPGSRGGPPAAEFARGQEPPAVPSSWPAPDLAEMLGQSMARRAAEVCAAGGHHLSLLGPPGAGKTMLAERIPTILPRLDRQAALEVTAIHSVAGTLPPEVPLLCAPPFLAPHHTATKAAIVGGGSGVIRPGSASLAHHGVLFLDEAPEFARDVLDALRQPLEAGEVVVARSGVTARFPARFTLVMASNPCPCARAAGSAEGCSCSPAARRRYLGRISGPLLDRVDVKIELEPVSRRELLSDRNFAESSRTVAAARGRGQAAVRAPAARHPMAGERRGPRVGAAPGLAARTGLAGRGGTRAGARPDQRAGRGQGHPRRLDPGRPGRASRARPRTNATPRSGLWLGVRR